MLRWRHDTDVFEALLRPQLEAIYRFAYYLTRHEADAEDLVQEACHQAFRKFHLFEQGTNFKAWLFRILRNLHIDRLRRRKREPGREALRQNLPARAEPEGGEGSDGSLFNPDRAGVIENQEVFYDLFGDEVKRFLAELPAEFRAALLLCDVEGLSYQEIGAVLDCPIGTVRSRISRARSYLREKLFVYAKSLGYVKDSIS